MEVTETAKPHSITVRRLDGDEMLDALYSLNQYSLHASPPLQNKEEWLAAARGRKEMNCHAALKDGAPVSVAVSTPMTQNLRGALYPAAGVWGVSTHPSARRKGYCRQIIASLLAADRKRGKVFSTLYPFRESFYERLGYVSFPLVKIAKLATASLAPLLKLDLEGEIELKLIGEAYDTYRAYAMEMRQNRHGMAVFDYGDTVAASRNRSWVALARFNGTVEGLMLYSLQGEDVTRYNFVALRFYALTYRARWLMLNWIARHIDQASRAEVYLPPYEYPELWTADMQVSVESTSRAAMYRVLDVERIGGMNVGDGSFSARILDPQCPWNEGIWRFESADGRLRVSRAAQSDGELTIQGLSALVAGTVDAEDFRLRGWGSPSDALQFTLRSMFSRMVPYLHEVF